MASQFTLIWLPPPAPFDFSGAAYSHGWVVLAPNQWDENARRMRRTERLGSGQIVHLTVAGDGSTTHPKLSIEAEHHEPLSRAGQREIELRVAHMLRFDEDFSSFYNLCRQRGPEWRAITHGLGRLLRSPTVFEDVIKTICTTNIQWGGTKRMVSALVDNLGEHAAEDHRRAFPTPEAVAATPEEVLRQSIGLGYRAPYVQLLARQVTSGEIDLQGLLDEQLSTADVHQALLSIKGIGHYAAATMLMLLGRYDQLPIDSIFRDFVGKKYFDGQWPGDREAQAIYDDWGRWKYLAYWFDIWQGEQETV